MGRTVRLGGGHVEITMPRIIMPQDVFQRIAVYVDQFPLEIAGIGIVREIAPLVFLVDDAFLVHQDTNTAAHVDITEGVARYVEECARRDASTRDVRFWWHSHVNFPAKWSQEDTATARRLFDDRWLVAMVMNKQREFRIRFECFAPVHIVFDDLPLELILRDAIDVRELALADIRTFVHAPPPKAEDEAKRGFSGLLRSFFEPTESELPHPEPTSPAPPPAVLRTETWAGPVVGSPSTAPEAQKPEATHE